MIVGLQRNFVLFVGICIVSTAFCLDGQTDKVGSIGRSSVGSTQVTAENIDEILAFLPPVVARYKGQVVTADDVRKIIKGQISMVREKGESVPEGDFRSRVLNVLNFMIDRDLLLKAAQADGYQPDMKSAAAEMAEIAAQLGPEALGKHLQTQNLTRLEAEKRRADEMAINQWIEDKIAPAAAVKEDEARRFYEQNKKLFKVPQSVQVSHIFLKKVGNSVAAGEKKPKQFAAELARQLRNGASFEILAAENSDCPSRSNGGDLGYLTPEQMPPEFRQVIETLEPGQISDVVETRFGCHILKCGARRQAQTLPFEEVKDRLLSNLKQHKIQDSMETRVQELRQEFEVEIFVTGN